jgi:hypothetical protein
VRIGEQRELELKRFPVGVDDDVDVQQKAVPKVAARLCDCSLQSGVFSLTSCLSVGCSREDCVSQHERGGVAIGSEPEMGYVEHAP